MAVEVRDPGAGVALTGAGLADVTEAIAEGDVGALDAILQDRSVDAFGRHIGERRIALQLKQLERRHGLHDRDGQVGQDVLCVVKLDAGKVVGLAADISNGEEGSLCSCVAQEVPPVTGSLRYLLELCGAFVVACPESSSARSRSKTLSLSMPAR